MNRFHHPLLFLLAPFVALPLSQFDARASERSGDGERAAAAPAAAATGAAAGTRSNGIRNFPKNLTLVEGGPSLRVPIVLKRGRRSGGTVTVDVRPVHPVDMPYTDLRVSHPALGPGRNRTELVVRLAIGNRPLKRHSRRFVVRTEDGRSVSERTLTVRVEPVDAPDIYLLAGQSNMVGATLKAHQVADPEDAKYGPLDDPHPRVKQLNVNFNTPADFLSSEDFRSLPNSLASPDFTLAIDPLHHSLLPGRSTKPDTSIGPGLTFGKKAVDLTEREVILVPAAWGGSGFCRYGDDRERAWNPRPRPESVFGGTGLFDRALLRVDYTIERTGGILRGILWNQGRHDSYNDECTRLYEENLVRLIEAFRGRIREDRRGAVARGPGSDVPFIGATMSQGKDARRDYSNPNAREIAVDDVYRNLADTVPYTDYVEMADIKPPRYPCGDGSCAHFGGRGYRIMGQRYHDALVRVFERGRVDTGSAGDAPLVGRNRPPGLVSGALYRWDGRNWLYRPGDVCQLRGGTSDVPAANRLDGDRSAPRYLALRLEIAGKSVPDCPPDLPVVTGEGAGGSGAKPSAPASPEGSGLVSGTLYRWDGRNFLYEPEGTCYKPGPSSDVDPDNDLDLDRGGARYVALRPAVKASGGRRCR